MFLLASFIAKSRFFSVCLFLKYVWRFLYPYIYTHISSFHRVAVIIILVYQFYKNNKFSKSAHALQLFCHLREIISYLLLKIVTDILFYFLIVYILIEILFLRSTIVKICLNYPHHM